MSTGRMPATFPVAVSSAANLTVDSLTPVSADISERLPSAWFKGLADDLALLALWQWLDASWSGLVFLDAREILLGESFAPTTGPRLVDAEFRGDLFVGFSFVSQRDDV